MKYIKLFQNFLNEGRVAYKIGDEFDPFGLAYWKNSSKPYSLEKYKGHHPNILQVTETLKITDIKGDYLIFNNGEYKITREEFENIGKVAL